MASTTLFGGYIQNTSFSDDIYNDEEALSAWIYKQSCTAKKAAAAVA